MPMVATYMEVLDDALWCRMPLNPSGGGTRLFHQALGQAVTFRPERVMTHTHTNLYKPNQLEHSQKFVVRHVTALFIQEAPDGADVPVLIDDPLYWNSIVTVMRNHKPMVEVPVHLLADPLVIFRQGAMEFLKAGTPEDLRLQLVELLKQLIIRGRYTLENPIAILDGDVFQAEVHHTLSLPEQWRGKWIELILMGERYRPTQ